jgi:hypothetical protein
MNWESIGQSIVLWAANTLDNIKTFAGNGKIFYDNILVKNNPTWTQSEPPRGSGWVLRSIFR